MESERLLPVRFRRLALIIKLILRAFRKHLVQRHIKESSPAEGPKKSTSGGNVLSLHQLSQPGLLQTIAQRIQQRLHRQATPTLATSTRSTTAADTPAPALRPAQQDETHELNSDVKQILTNSSWTRTPSQIKLVFDVLCKYESFMDYPVDTQMALCRVAYYQGLRDGRIVFREGRQPALFYLLLSGKVQLTRKTREGGGDDVVQTLTAGESFSADEIIEEEQRPNTCTVKDFAELLAISKSDYIDLSLRQSSLRYQKAKPYLFCKTIPLLVHWPIEELEGHRELCLVQYYKPNAVVTKDSHKCEWIYVVMSGTCRVVKKLSDVVYSKTRELNVPPMSRDPKGKRVLFPDLPESTDSGSRRAYSKTGMKMNPSISSGDLVPQNPKRTVQLRQSRTITDWHQKERKKISHPVRKQFLIQLQILQPKDVFGLSPIIFDGEPSITLVSNGAEVILISKPFITRYLTESTRAKLQKQVMEYPSEEAMMKRIRDYHTWNSFKQ